MAAASGSDDEEELGACGGGGNPRPGPSRDFSSYDDDDLEEVVVSASTKKSPGKPRKRLRPKCQYAEDCYRKNPHHFQAYCHPGDREWNERGPRPKARCPFGSFCNRWIRCGFGYWMTPGFQSRCFILSTLIQTSTYCFICSLLQEKCTPSAVFPRPRRWRRFRRSQQ